MAIERKNEKDAINSLNLFFTGKCNLSCNYCFFNKKGWESRTLDENLLKKSVDLLLSYPGKNKVLGFSGGEPLMERALLAKVCGYARQAEHRSNADLKMAIVSNGTLLNEKAINQLVKNSVEIKISIDGEKSVHDKNRPFKKSLGSSTFDALIQNAKLLEKKDCKLTASMVFGPSNIDYLFNGIKFLHKSGFSQIDFFPDLFSLWKPAELAKMKKVFAKFAKYYFGLFSQNRRVFKNSFLGTIAQMSEKQDLRQCRKANVGPDGKIYVCDKVFSLEPRWRKKYEIGNVFKGIDNGRRKALLGRLRRNFNRTSGLQCGRCFYLRHCFCPLGHYIIFSSGGYSGKKISARDFFKSFCAISKIYNKTFLRLEGKLKKNKRFCEIYRIDACG